MRKVMCLITALLVCASLACSVFAAEEFVPSISYKGVPEIVTVKDANGKEAVAVVRNTAGSAVSYVYEECLLVTPVSEASTSTKNPAAAKTELLSVYKALSDGTMTLPYSSKVKASDMVIKDLFDVSFICTGHNHDESLAAEGVTVEFTFDLDVAKDENVVVMTYKNNAWGEIAKVVNNGDGTVTCTFEHLCPVSISVQGESSDVAPGTGDEVGGNMIMWIAIMTVSAAAMVVMIATRRKVQR